MNTLSSDSNSRISLSDRFHLSSNSPETKSSTSPSLGKIVVEIVAREEAREDLVVASFFAIKERYFMLSNNNDSAIFLSLFLFFHARYKYILRREKRVWIIICAEESDIFVIYDGGLSMFI